MKNITMTFPCVLPAIIEDDVFLYPLMIVPIFLSDEDNIAIVNQYKNSPIFIATRKDREDKEGKKDSKDASPKSKGKNLKDIREEELTSALASMSPTTPLSSCYDLGVVGQIMRSVTLSDGRVKILFRAEFVAKIMAITSTKPLNILADLVEYRPIQRDKLAALFGILKEKIALLYDGPNSQDPLFTKDFIKTLSSQSDTNHIVDLVASTLRLKKEQNYALYKASSVEERLIMIIEMVLEAIETQSLQKRLSAKVHDKMERVNKEYYLKEQLRQIQKELGIDKPKDEEIDEYLKQLDKLKPHMNAEAYKEVKKQIDRLSRMHQDSADANLLQNYIEWALELPFGKLTSRDLTLPGLIKQLDTDHYSLENPKDRIVEYFATKQLLRERDIKEDKAKGTILCFYGPPGVGKTSLANSIAKAAKQELVRIALGGLEDVNELRGHRRTYIGAMPGRITQGLINAKSMDPVIVLDEIDKVGNSHRGDPTSVLLEILDPEQNIAFRDYYMNFSIDLSSVMFIATANNIYTIPAPLRDRMEFIEIASYTPNEKYNIAKKYLIPQEVKKHGLKPAELSFTKKALEIIIQNYTREAGVRGLRRVIAKIARKVAREILVQSAKEAGRQANEQAGKAAKNTKDIKEVIKQDEIANAKKLHKKTIDLKVVKQMLKKPIFEETKANKEPIVGVVNGLAFTPVGGDILKIEAIYLFSKTSSLKLTGSLGDVMKESAEIAYSVVKNLITHKKLKLIHALKDRDFTLHLHVPEGATPKDGPSAGGAMALVIASSLSNTPIRQDVALTGELTLTGEILPIGGLKEKLIAAYKGHIKLALIPRKNYARDLDDLPDEVLENMEIRIIDTIDDVLRYALIR